MNTSMFRFYHGTTIAQLQTFVQNESHKFGPLIAIGVCPDIAMLVANHKCGSIDTVPTFFAFKNSEPDPKAKSIQLKICQSSTPPAIAGFEVICFGDCIVDGNAQLVAAYRPA